MLTILFWKRLLLLPLSISREARSKRDDDEDLPLFSNRVAMSVGRSSPRQTAAAHPLNDLGVRMID